MTDLINRLLNDECSDTPELRHEAATALGAKDALLQASESLKSGYLDALAAKDAEVGDRDGWIETLKATHRIEVEGLCAVLAAKDAKLERLNELLRGTGANRYWEGRWRDADAEIRRLWEMIEDAEIALGIWDEGRASEYWLRHPERDGRSSVTAGQGGGQ